MDFLKKKSTRKYIFLFGILVLLIVLIYNYTYLEGLVGDFFEKQIKSWGYYGFVISVFVLELIPQPFLSALVPFTTGLIFDLNSTYLILLMVGTSILANYLAYFFGRHYADTIALYLVSRKNYEKSLIWFEKYGNKSITILALTPLPYFPVMGRIFKMTTYEFTIYAIIPRIFHFVIFSALILWAL